MASKPTVAGLEIVVSQLDDALALFVDTLGLELAYRGPSPDVPAEVAVLDGGAIAITLIQPIDSDGAVFPDPKPRLSQIVLGCDPDGLDEMVGAVEAAGLPVDIVGSTRAFVPPAVMEGVLGSRTALVFSTVEVDDDAMLSDGVEPVS